MTNPFNNRETIIEFQASGAYMRISAMDVASLTEVVSQAPRATSEAQMKSLILRKMEYVLRKKGIID